MKKIRIGKDIFIKWEILTEGEVKPLSEIEPTQLIMTYPNGKIEEIEYTIEDDNVVSFYLKGNMFETLGIYKFHFWGNVGVTGQTVIDNVDAFTLVRYTTQESDFVNDDLRVSTVELTGNLRINGEGGIKEYFAGYGIDISEDRVISINEEVKNNLEALNTDMTTAKTDITELMDEVFPIIFTMVSNNGGNYEVGQTVNATATFSVKRKGEDITDKTITADSGTVSGYSWSDTITTNKTVNFTLDGTSKKQTLSWAFMYYRFLGATTTDVWSNEKAEAYIINTMRGNKRELSTSISKTNITLKPNEYYVFAVPNTDTEKTTKFDIITSSGGEVTTKITGSMEIQLINTDATINYDYVVVPASSINWTFNLNGSLIKK